MEILYDKKVIADMLFDIAELTGITMSFYDYEGNCLANSNHPSLYCMEFHKSKEIKLCKEFSNRLYEKSKKTLSYEEGLCFAGLYEASVPIVIDGIWAGHIALAGARTEDSEKYVLLNENESLELFHTQPFYTSKQLDALKNILPKIIFDSAISFNYNNLLDEITTYIKNNLSEKLTIEHICNKFHTNKNILYSLFKQTYSTTVNEYITDKRIKKAISLLSKGESSEKIINEIGIENYSYFCRLFKKKTGYPPSHYR